MPFPSLKPFLPGMPPRPSLLASRRESSGRAPPFGDRKFLRAVIVSYAPDWIITLVLAGGFYALERVSGFKRQFSLEDTSLRHPFAEHERIPDPALIVISLVGPVVIQALVNLLSVRTWWDLHTSYLGLVLGLAITGVITQVTKITVGRPRPDVISRCVPIPGSVDPTWGLSSIGICTQTDSFILNDGWRSFPSGHASTSFAGLGFLSFYIAGKLHLFDRRGHTAKAWIAITPLCGAALVAISRTMDYRHHWQDVTAGSILGFIVAYFSYRQYYPPLTSEKAHRPHPPRVEHDDSPLLPIHANAGRFEPGHDHRESGEYRDNDGADEVLNLQVSRNSREVDGVGLREDNGLLADAQVWRRDEVATSSK